MATEVTVMLPNGQVITTCDFKKDCGEAMRLSVYHPAYAPAEDATDE